MAASKATTGYGSKIQIGNADGPPETFSDIAEVTKISFTGSGAAPVDITHMQSDSGYKEWSTGSIDPGELSVEMNYIWNDTNQLKLVAALVDRATHNFRVIYPGMTSPTPKAHKFAAYVTKFAITGETESKITGTVTLKISGPITFGWTIA